MAGKQISRRKFLALTAAGGASALLAACGAAPTSSNPGATAAAGAAGTTPPEAGAAGTPAAAATTAAAAAGGAAAGGAPTPTGTIPPVSKVANVIDWWNGWGGQGGKALDQVADAWNKKGKGFKVQRTTVSSVSQKLLTAIAGGNPPDVETGNIAYAEFYARGAMQPLDELIDTSKAFKRTDILDTSWNYAKWEGKTYGVPSVESFLRYALIVNVDLAKKAGL